MTPIKTAVIGFGISAKVFHTPFLHLLPEYDLVTVMERTKMESVKVYPDVKIVRTLDEILKDRSIELIVITTPNETHFPYAKSALEAGKHVILEKPFTNTSEEGRTLIEIAKQNNKVLSVYQNRRYVSDFITIRDILRKNLLGKVHECFAHYDRYRPEAKPNAWREEKKPGSGILYDLGAHLIDQACCLFGLPTAITADVRQQRPHAKVDDYFMIRLDYPALQVHLHAAMLVRLPGPRYMIHGWNGSYIKYGEDPQEAALRAGNSPGGKDWGKEPEKFYGQLHTIADGKEINETYPSQSGNFGAYYKNLYETIRNGAPLKEKPEHGFNTIRLIELAFESSRQKRTLPVTQLIDTTYE
ncbi:MAG TPA: oxidoreductase [Flavitalea sp.]|nr:oxidoreductase [Flavitalea sp.]